VPVRSATSADVDAVVSIHLDALPNDVAPSLGPRFLARFYGRVLASPDQQLLVIAHCDVVQGFCALSMGPPPLRASVRAPDVVAFACRVVRSPRLLAKAAAQARHPAVGDWRRAAEIAFIAVARPHSGHGGGAELLRAATAAAADGGKEVVVTKTANRRLADFYRREFAASVIAEFAAAGSTYVVLEWPAGSGATRIPPDP
jgi:GNAT superfamily N-acetyltransferase